MADLHSVYLGLRLRNPLIISSSGLTDQVSKIKKLEECGAGAVVLKSLFEEQILHEAGKMMDQTDYPGAEDYLKVYARNHSVSEYLRLIEDAKKETRIPVIASINCVSTSEWIDFA
ncbi:MAG TPA: diguanylate cyclase, partial [Bacteroidales bacterium]|nr:diguanylate cyclase [Bacteroidales bacterium]